MLSKDHTKTWQVGGSTLVATVSPCSWMYSGYGLQISVEMNDKHGGNAVVHLKEKDFKDCDEKDFDALCEKVKIIPCKTCGKPAFDPTSVSTNRDRDCESCFMVKLDAEFEKAQELEDKRQVKDDLKMFKKGYRFRIKAWVHAGGDDRVMLIYFVAKPTKAEIEKELKKAKSRVTDDWTAFELNENGAQPIEIK